MKVKEAMHRGVDWVGPDTPVTDLAKLMCQHDIGAIPIGEDDLLIGMVTDRDLCIGCRMCVVACPFGGTSVDADERTVIRCDLCEGEPKCAENCPYEAIVYVDEDRQGLHKKRRGAERFLASLETLTGKGAAG